MLPLLKQCSSLFLSKSPLIPVAPTFLVQSRTFRKLLDKNHGDPNNKDAKCPQPSIDEDNIFDSRQEMYKDGFGVKLYDLKDGERKNLKAVIARFKRLEWGPWIRYKCYSQKFTFGSCELLF